MSYKFKYKTKEEQEQIISENSNLFLIEEQYITEGNFLIFVDESEYKLILEKRELDRRLSDITLYVNSYLNENNTEEITVLEDSILKIEENKITNGGI